MLFCWVKVNWVYEFSIMIFGVNGSSGGVGNNDELVDSLLVMEVLVQVVLEVLDLIHVLLDEIISSYFLEWESLVVKFPCVYSHWSGNWLFSLLFHLSVDVHSINVMLFLERSGEEIELNV